MFGRVRNFYASIINNFTIMNENTKSSFAPHLCIPAGIRDLSFYSNAFSATELRRWNNEDGTVHVAEFSLGDQLFHVHEEKISAGQFCPDKVNGTTALIGLFVEDVDSVIDKAVEAGGIIVNPPQSYDYGYRQAEVKDPFGHVWLIEMKI
jgi:PhnB protein